LYGVEYLALSLNHPIVLKAAEKDERLRKFLSDATWSPARPMVTGNVTLAP
jgi:hypothetical protein